MFENYVAVLDDKKGQHGVQIRLLDFDLKVVELLEDLVNQFGDEEMAIGRLESLVEELKQVYVNNQ